MSKNLKDNDLTEKEQVNEDEPSLIRYIINKEEMFKLIKDDSSDNNNNKYYIDIKKNKNENRVKNFF